MMLHFPSLHKVAPLQSVFTFYSALILKFALEIMIRKIGTYSKIIT